MRSLFLILILSLPLSGCASRQAMRDLKAAEDRYSQLSTEVENERRTAGIANQSLIAALKDAEVKLEQARAEVLRSRIEKGAEVVNSATGMLAPVIGTVFPPAVAILGALSAAAGAVATNMKKKEQA